MLSKDDVLRTKVLIEINEDFHQADKINFALESDILSELIKCFSEEDIVIRELASRAVLKVASTDKGRKVLVDTKIVENIRQLFEDKQVKIRDNAYVALINLTDYTEGVDAVIGFDIIPVLVDKLVDEKDESILILILTLLKILLEGERAPPIFLATDAL